MRKTKARSKRQRLDEMPLSDRLATEARILRAAVALMDRRTGQAKSYERMIYAFDLASLYVAGVEANRARSRKRRPSAPTTGEER